MFTTSMARAAWLGLVLAVAVGLPMPTARAARPRGARLTDRIERLERRAETEAALAAAAAAAPGPVPRVWRPRAAVRAALPPGATPPGAPITAAAPGFGSGSAATTRGATARPGLPPAARPVPPPAQAAVPRPRPTAKPADARPMPASQPARQPVSSPALEPADDGTRSVLVGGSRADAPAAAAPTPADAPIELLPTP